MKKRNEVQHNLVDSENNLKLEEVERRKPIKSQKQEIERAQQEIATQEKVEASAKAR